MGVTAEDWTAALASPHRIAVRATIVSDRILGEEIPVNAGSVTLDAPAASRGRLDMTVTDDGTLGLVPTEEGDLLNVYGNELKIERGLYMPGESEPTYVSLGVFGIQTAAPEDTGSSLSVKITGLDRSKRIIDARFETPGQVDIGTKVRDAIMDLILLADIGAEFDFADFDKEIQNQPKIYEEQGDRWGLCQEMATDSGMELYLDGDGIYVLRPKPMNLDVNPVAEIVDGEGGTLVNVSAEWNREGIYNRVIATGEGTGLDAAVAPRGVATDDNPLSPTYYYGRFGKVPRFYASDMLYDDDDALNVAQGLLVKELGRQRKVTFGAFVNPALEPSDVIGVTRERAGVDENHILDTLTVPLDVSSAMTGNTRATQAVSI